jgi:hypothetical protein
MKKLMADNIPMAEFMVAGVRFRNLEASPEPDATLVLTPEPDNKYDPYAVKVSIVLKNKLTHIGYIPKHLSRIVAVLISKNVPLSGRVRACDMTQHLCLVHLYVGA